jgi:hypothetical protein
MRFIQGQLYQIHFISSPNCQAECEAYRSLNNMELDYKTIVFGIS